MTPHIFAIYFFWHYGPGLKGLLKIWKNFLLFGWHYFSIGILLNSLFEPWHRISSSYGRGFDIGRWSRAFADNMITRTLGAIMRSVVISVGLVFEAVILVTGAGITLVWLSFPIATPLAILVSLSLIAS